MLERCTSGLQRSKVTADRVEAKLLGVGPLGPLDQPVAGHLGAPGALARLHGIERAHVRAGGRRALTSQNARTRAVEGDDVELAPAGPEVALDDREAAALEVLGGELLAEAPDRGAGHLAPPAR